MKTPSPQEAPQLIFGKHSMADAEGFTRIKSSGVTNPCIAAYGAGPLGATCKTCVHLIRKQKVKVYRKCAFRENTNGPATDHKATWPACGKYEREKS